MPYVRTTTKRLRRRTKRKQTRRARVSRSLAPMPLRYTTKLRYQQQISLDPDGITPAPAFYQFGANNPFKPDTSGAGHQPRGWDDLMKLYETATCIGSKITATFTAKSSGNNGATIAGIHLQNQVLSSGTLSVNDALESRLTTWCTLGATVASSDTRTRSMKCSVKKFSGVSTLIGNQDFHCTDVASPTQEIYYQLFADTADPSINASASTLWVNVIIDYLVVFTNPKRPAQS